MSEEINNAMKEINEATKQIFGNGVRINIRVGNTNRGIFFTAEKEPQNEPEWITLLEELVAGMKAPAVPDPEVLGEYSP